MQNENVPLNKFTLVSLFKACGMVQDLLQGRELHEYARKRGLTTDPYVGSTLVSMYGRCGTVTDAENAFCELSHPDIVSWTSLLSAYVEQGDGEKALLLYRQMLEEGIGKAELPLVIALKACGILAEKDAIEDQPVKLRSRALALALHADARAKGAISGLLVGNTLVSTYGKCRAIAESEATFCSMSFHDVVSWNVMLSAYVDGFKVVKALQLYCQMQKEKVDAELLTFVILLQACSALAKQENSPSINGHSVKLIVPEIAKALQADAHRRDLETDISVGSALLDVYRKCGNIHEAEDIFNKLSHRNAVSWTTLLFAYVEGGAIDKALTLYVRMREEEVGLDPIALVSVLQVCRECGASQLCNHIHFIVISLGYDHISGMQTSIICTYGNCGSMGDAQSVFDGLLVPDNVSWSACVDGHASAGSSSKGLHSYECFVLGGQKPDEIMLTSVLSGCCYSGLSTVGAEYFDSLNQDFAINLNLKHYSVLLDLLGRTGDLNRAESLLKKMPVKADLPVWLSILGACRTHGHVQLAQCAFYHAVKLEPKSASVYILMSNIYADAGLQNGVEEVERLRWEQAAWDDE
ncbi:hypothetical protein KP509_23G005700 [Ceratopteris richardii]|nr:hypothetical protein KP509_23G005700 [Ceratopteris richardii]